MGRWHKAGCMLCARNGGIEVEAADNRVAGDRGDKDDVRSEAV
ncbi:MAG TPA: hypothetical protein PK836_08950 [Syntrophales bacterium]|nr:hypothetical protein [Syntrophales bacterium]